MSEVNRQWLLATRPQGMVSADNFEYRETAIPEPGDGEVLIRNLYLSFDPTQRGWLEDRESYLPPVQIGEVMRAGSVGQVVKSNTPDFAEDQQHPPENAPHRSGPPGTRPQSRTDLQPGVCQCAGRPAPAVWRGLADLGG